jgi:cytochrome c-type biogenesis protein CcmH/NrfG
MMRRGADLVAAPESPRAIMNRTVMLPLAHVSVDLLLLCGLCCAQTPLADFAKALKEARKMQAKGDFDGVIRTLATVIDEHADDPEAQHLLGVANYQQQDYGAASRHLSVALKLETENSAAWKQTAQALAMAYYFSNRPQDALPLLEKVVVWNPGDTYYRYALAMTYVYVRDWDAARRTFAVLFRVPPDSPQAFVLTADFLVREKFPAEAEKLILEAHKKNTALPDLHYRLGLIALTNGSVSDGLRHFENELATNPMHPMAWHYLGYAYVQLGKLDEAVEALQRSIWLNLRSTESYVLIADAYNRLEKYAEAEHALQRVLALAPNNYEARFLLARVYHKTNRPELAKKEIAIANRLRSESGAK